MQALLKNKQYFFIGFALLFLAALLVGFAIQKPYIALAPLAILLGYFVLIDTRWLYAVLLFSIPFSVNLNEFNGPSLDFPTEPLMLVITAIFPFLFLQNKDSFYAKNIFRNSVIGALGIWYIWMIVCTVNSTFPILSTKFIVAKIWYYIPFVFYTAMLVFQDTANLKKMYRVFMPIAVITTIVILYRHYQIGFSFEMVNSASAPVFRNHVISGSFFSMILPLLGIGLWLTKRFTFAWWLQAISFLIVFAAVSFAYSRGAWAAILFALVIWAALRIGKAHYVISMLYIAIFGIVLWLGQNNRYIDYAPDSTKGIMHDGLVDHLVATIRGRDISSNERFYRWVAAARLSYEHPIAGVGPNTFYEHYKGFTVNNFKTYVSRNEERSTTHNYFLFSLVEQGYVGMFLYAFFIWIVFYFGQKVYKSYDDRTNKTIIAGIVTMLAAFFINNCLSEFLENDKLGGLFFIGIGVLVAMDLRKKESI